MKRILRLIGYFNMRVSFFLTQGGFCLFHFEKKGSTKNRGKGKKSKKHRDKNEKKTFSFRYRKISHGQKVCLFFVVQQKESGEKKGKVTKAPCFFFKMTEEKTSLDIFQMPHPTDPHNPKVEWAHKKVQQQILPQKLRPNRAVEMLKSGTHVRSISKRLADKNLQQKSNKKEPQRRRQQQGKVALREIR